MKYIIMGLFLFTSLFMVAGQAMAEVRVRLGFGGPYYGHHGYWGRGYRGYGPAVVIGPGFVDPYGPYYYPDYYPAPVYVAPVYADPNATGSPYANPTATPAPAAQPEQSGTPVALTGDYPTDLATLNGKLAKYRRLLDRQKKNGGLTEAQYNKFTNALESVEHDEHAWSYNNGGRLTDQNLADLIGRTDHTGQEIQEALAQ